MEKRTHSPHPSPDSLQVYYYLEGDVSVDQNDNLFSVSLAKESTVSDFKRQVKQMNPVKSSSFISADLIVYRDRDAFESSKKVLTIETPLEHHLVIDSLGITRDSPLCVFVKPPTNIYSGELSVVPPTVPSTVPFAVTPSDSFAVPTDTPAIHPKSKDGEYWYQLVDSNGDIYKNCSCFKVKVDPDADIADFLEAVKAKHPLKLSSFEAIDLKAYKNEESFKKRKVAGLGDEEHLNPRTKLENLNIDINDTIYVVLPTRGMILEEGDLIDSNRVSSMSSASAEHKSQRIKISDLTRYLKSFANAELVEECIIQSQDQMFLPYPEDEVKKLYVRKCYADVFDLLIQQINIGKKNFAISGTPGIGKSLCFVYILYRLMADFVTKTLSLKPNRIVYQIENTYECFELQQQVVTEVSKLEAAILVREQDTFYVIDGAVAQPLVMSCTVLFISSPRSEYYKNFVKRRKATQWHLPVWTLDELQNCYRHCYPTLTIDMVQERYRIYGGVARFVFQDNLENIMDNTLGDVDAVKGVRNIGNPTRIFQTSHILLHIIISNDGQYKFSHVDIASRYVGEQLLIRQSAQMITNLQEMFGGSPNEISRHLFEIYGHLVFSVGGLTLKCRCLESGNVTEIRLDDLYSQRNTFGRETIPTAEDLVGKYYEPTDDDTFPAIDSLSSQGMFQFTVAADHPIRGVQVLRRLCELYSEPKLYFVVPPHRFAYFKKQSFKAKRGTENVSEVSNLKQYVLELPVISRPSVFKIENHDSTASC